MARYKTKGGENKCQIPDEQSSFSYFRVKSGQVISTVAQEMTIFLPWKKFVLPEPLAPTAKKLANRYY